MPPMPRRFDLIVFDWDGTLMDSARCIAESLQAACGDCGYPVPSDRDARYVIGLGLNDAMAHVLMTVELPGGASLDAAAARLGVAPEDLDAEYGVVPIDPEHHLYSVMAEERAIAGTGARPGTEGPFSNPRIEPFGPPEPE